MFIKHSIVVIQIEKHGLLTIEIDDKFHYEETNLNDWK